MKVFSVVLVLVVLLIGGCTKIVVSGWRYETGRGERTGYVTAVEKTGMFWKTGSVYIKTDTQSSQEDVYCVQDDGLYSKLEELSKEKAKVTVKYRSVISTGLDCNSEAEIVYGLAQ